MNVLLNKKKRGMPMSIGKMSKYTEMHRNRALRKYLPKTRWLNRERTRRMVKTYQLIFIKPNHGSGGSGIIRARRLEQGYEVRCGEKRVIVKRSKYVYPAVENFRSKGDRYLVQQGLKLAKYNGSIFDVRVYMQKPEKEWVISGITARVAASGKYVTNYQKGGYGKPLRDVLEQVFSSGSKADKCMSRMLKLSKRIAATVSKYHEVRELGIDLAVEPDGRIWIIEANSRPGHMLFTQLPDKSMLRTIMKNKQKIYGGTR